jgi:hypothetical protein
MSKRIFYASHAVGVTNVVDGDNEVVDGNTYTLDGVQSVSLNTNYNLEQVFQLGRLDIYDNYSTDPEVEITINKALDGRPLIWNRVIGADAGSLVEKANHRPDIVLHIDEETQAAIDDVPNMAIKMTGCYLSSLNYTFPVDGNFTEELTFLSSNKTADADGLDAPPNTDPDTRILRRQNFNLSTSTLPSGVQGKCITNISISADLGREKMFCLGQYQPYHRYVNFPVEITVAFDTTPSGDPDDSLIVAGPDINEFIVPECGHPAGNGKEECDLRICRTPSEGEGGEVVYQFDLGTGCSLQSVSYSGGDTGGGVVTETYTYIAYNTLSIVYQP